MKKILLVGNPNVGKSVVFSRLTGVHVVASNYSGTTVEYTVGKMRIDSQNAEVIDIPGTYSLSPESKAEQVASEMITNFKENDGNIFVNIIDATNLERNLALTLELVKKKIPLIVCLNMWDETKHTGIDINVNKLEEILGVPIVTTTAITGEGIKQLVTQFHNSTISSFSFQDKWKAIGQIIEDVQVLKHRHHTFAERLGDASIHKFYGIPISLFILFAAFTIIRFIGETMITYILEPIFNGLWAPVVMKLSSLLTDHSIIHNIIIGKLVNGQIDFVESLGLLTTGLFVPIAMVLPYIIGFYLVLSFLEDSGYLPRLGVLVDNMMHRLGIHGLAIVPMLLGLGCNVPGAMATRILDTRRERFIATTMMAIAVPCFAQLAMIIGLIGKFGAIAFALVFGTLFIVWMVLGFLLNKVMKGESPEIFVEIPPYRLPSIRVLMKKLRMRVWYFIKEALPFMLLGVLFMNVLYALHIIDFIGNSTAPIITGILGLPKEAVGALIVGFLRKDVAIGMLSPLNMSMGQLVIASVVLTMYFPCIATFTVMLKELGLKDMLKSSAIMIFSSLLVGGIMNLFI
ncbi:MAG: ferrous iron transporter B [Candidatus Cloacimonetes bacterium]|nr:ferrous iron transporter B [Candidatus Cloacimonadota bacterium]